MSRQTITCKLTGHIWQAAGMPRPDLTTATGSYIVHRRCFRCGKYEKVRRQPVASAAKETN